jgi:cardiolipin synthase A/B
MAWSVVVAIVGLGLAAVGCGSSNATGEDDMVVDAAVDASEGVGCSALEPRSTPLEAFAGPAGLEQRMTELIDSARQSLDVHMYLFTVDALAERILAAKARGVAVRVILDRDHLGNGDVRSALTAGGVTVRNSAAIYPYSHAKYLIVDRKVMAIMSMNFNFGAMANERNYGVIDRDPDDIADAIAIFEMDWAAAAGETPRPADLECTRLVVAPTNARLRVLELISGAKSTLDVEALYVSEANVRNAVASAADRGVMVRVILEGSGEFQQTNSETAEFLHAHQIPVHYVTDQFYLHAKLIIADGVAFIGSENFSVSGLTKNRELGVMAFEPGAASVAMVQFDADWSSTPSAF